MSEVRTDGSNRTRKRRAFGAALYVAAYVSLHWVSQQIVVPTSTLPVVWLPVGLLAALLMHSSGRAWPLLMALSALAHALAAILWGVVSLRAAVASLLATLIGSAACALALRQWHGREATLDEPRAALLLLYAAPLAGGACGALVFAVLTAVGGEIRTISGAFSAWFAAAFLGLTIIVPLHIAASDTVITRSFSLRRQAPGLLLCLAFAWLVAQAFSHDPSQPPAAFDLPLASLPLLLWVFLEYHVLLLALCCAWIGLFAAAGTAAGQGPFAVPGAAAVLPPVQWSVAFFCAGLLVLSAALRRALRPDATTEGRVGVREQSRREFVEDSAQGYWYADVVPPLPVSLPPEDQVERLLACARFSAAQPQATQLYRALGTTTEGLVGLTLGDHARQLGVDIRPGLRRFVSEGYRLRRYQWRVDRGERAGQVIRSSCRGEVRGGLLYAIRGADLDVSEQHDAEMALRFSEERFYRTFKNTSDAVVIVSMSDGTIINVNAGFETLSGFGRSEVTGRDPGGFLRIESPRSRRRLLLDLGRHGIVRDHELRFRDKHGGALTCLVSAEVVDLGGQPCLVAIGHDITQQRETEAALRRSEQRFSMAFRNSPDAILLIEFESGRIVELNEGLERMTGLRREDAIGRSMLELGGWSDPREREKMIAILRAEGRVEQFEIESPLSGSDILTLSLSAELIELEGREFLIATVRDISESRRAARLLDEYQLRLKSLASQLTLTEERVRRRIAIELHDGLSQELAATIMQLTALRATLDEPAQPRLQESIDILGQAMTSARTMVNRLSRRQLYESGLADALAALARDTARDEDFHCEFVDRREADSIRSDGAENVRIVLYRSVDELLQNVAKYAQARRVDLVLDQDESNLVVTVADDGTGFDTRALDTRGWSSRGFGLFSIRQQIESLGGEFTLSSGPGQGTTVVLSTPLDDDHERQLRRLA